MTNADPLPPTVLSRKAVVYVRQSTQTQVQVHLESQRRQRMTSLVKPAAMDFTMSMSSTTILADPPAAPWHARASRSWSPGFAPARSALCFASTPPVSPATVGTGIICWSCAALSMPASSTSMASIIRVVRMTVCFWE